MRLQRAFRVPRAFGLALAATFWLACAGPAPAADPERSTGVSAPAKTTPGQSEGIAAEVDRLMAEVSEGGARRSKARKQLIALGRPVTPELIRHMRSPDFPVRWEVVNVMGYVKDPAAAEPLVDRILNDDNPHVRWRAIWALGSVGDSRAAERFREAIETTSGSTHWHAVVGGSMFGVTETLPELQRQAKVEDDSFETWEAINGLGRVTDPSSVPILKQVLKGSRTRMRREAVLSLGKLDRHPEAVEALIAALEDADAGVRWRAAMGLKGSRQAEVREAARARLEVEKDKDTRRYLEKLVGRSN